MMDAKITDPRQEAESLLRRLREAGFTAYFAGGCVRDMLLGQTPKDYDIATDATPEQVQKLFPKGHNVGAHFGVMVVWSGGHQFEIATFRTDGSYRDGRRPESVEFSTPEHDAQRRDFTVNGVFFDPLENRVIEFVGGQEDLNNKVLRAIGNPEARFREDFLRLMRAVRFAETLDFEIEPATWAAVKMCAPELQKISVERVREEFVKMLVHPNRVRGFDLLDESGLLEQFLPEITALKGCDQPPQWHPEGDVFVHTRLMLSLAAPDAPLPLLLSILLHDIGKPGTFAIDETGRIRFSGHDELGATMAEVVLRRMKFPNEITDAVVEMVAYHMRYMNVQDMRVAKLKRFMARPTFMQELELHRIDCAGSNGFTDNYDFLQAKLEEFSKEPIIPPKLISGRDLMELGIQPGPKMGEILEAVETRQLEGALLSREDALEWVRGEFA